jgi:hypothetical protein
MQTSKWAASMLAVILAGTSLRAEEWVNETFEGEVATTVQKEGAARKVQWLVKEQGTLNVVDDSKGLASGKALQGQQIMGVIPAVLLTNPGDSITVQFDFRLASPVQDGKGYSPRFGIYYIQAADSVDPWTVTNGNGYYAGLTAGAVAAGVELNKEAGGDGQILQGPDNTVLTTGTAEYWVNDGKKHTAQMTIAMLDSGLKISVKLDGTLMAESTDLFASEALTLNRFALLSQPNKVYFDNFKVNVQMAGSSQPTP